MSQRIVIETECEHGSKRGHYLPHEAHQGPHVLQNRYGPDCPHCFGMTREVLVLDEMVEKAAPILYEGLVGPDFRVVDKHFMGKRTREVTRAVLVAALGLEET